MRDSDSAPDTAASPEAVSAAFATLGNETRLSIVQALWERPGGEATFSELQAAVGMRDSGQFNYHLNKLVGRYLRKEGDGYRLSGAGVSVLGAVLSGSYTPADRIAPFAFGDTCLECDAALLASYEDDNVNVFCPSCPEVLLVTHVPAGVVEEYDREELPSLLDRWGRVVVQSLRQGFCTNCRSRVRPELELDYGGVDVAVAYECGRCPKVSYITPGMFLSGNPTVVSFFHERGVDLATEPLWRHPFMMEGTGDVVSTDPVVVEKRIRVGDDVLLATLADTAAETDSDERGAGRDGTQGASGRDGHGPADGGRLDVRFDRLPADRARVE